MSFFVVLPFEKSFPEARIKQPLWGYGRLKQGRGLTISVREFACERRLTWGMLKVYLLDIDLVIDGVHSRKHRYGNETNYYRDDYDQSWLDKPDCGAGLFISLDLVALGDGV
jgi:hypothetical protein